MPELRYPLDDFLAEALPRAREHRAWNPADGALPAIYLAHGAPPLLDDGPWMRQLFDWSLRLPKPRAVLMVSAHWERAPLTVSVPEANTPLVYDFGGFEQRFYQLRYPTPDASALAARVTALMADTRTVHQHAKRGLDHGAWIPAMVMWPLGDVPVLQLSMPTEDPQSLLEIGRRLQSLREEGVLVVGSGFLTHGLPFLTAEHIFGRGNPPGWSRDFDAWAEQALATGDVDELAAFRDKAPGMPYAHPSAEHYVPLFVTLGAGGDHAPVRTAIDGFGLGLSKRSIEVG